MTSTPHLRLDDPRSTLLRAAIAEFAERGEAGARTDAIARAAGVNKALLHYYFGTKQALYAAALDTILAGLKEHYLGLLAGPGSAGHRILRYVRANFDRMASSRDYARVLGHEMMRARSGASASLPHMAQAYFGPLHAQVCATLAEGIRSGEFRALDPAQTALTLTGANVFYFIAAPVLAEVADRDPREPDMLRLRRAAILDHAAALLFEDRAAGQAMARALLEAPPDLPPDIHEGGLPARLVHPLAGSRPSRATASEP